MDPAIDKRNGCGGRGSGRSGGIGRTKPKLGEVRFGADCRAASAGRGEETVVTVE
jgi:hypothetical protein